MPDGLSGIMTAQPLADLMAFFLTAVFAYLIKEEISVEEKTEDAGEVQCQNY